MKFDKIKKGGFVKLKERHQRDNLTSGKLYKIIEVLRNHRGIFIDNNGNRTNFYCDLDSEENNWIYRYVGFLTINPNFSEYVKAEQQIEHELAIIPSFHKPDSLPTTRLNSKTGLMERI